MTKRSPGPSSRDWFLGGSGQGAASVAITSALVVFPVET